MCLLNKLCLNDDWLCCTKNLSALKELSKYFLVWRAPQEIGFLRLEEEELALMLKLLIGSKTKLVFLLFDWSDEETFTWFFKARLFFLCRLFLLLLTFFILFLLVLDFRQLATNWNFERLPEAAFAAAAAAVASVNFGSTLADNWCSCGCCIGCWSDTFTSEKQIAVFTTLARYC